MLTDDRRAEIRQYAESFYGTECAMIRDLLADLGDEEAAHQETVRLWQAAKAESERLAGENARLTRQLEECWGLLTLATIPMGIGPGAERLLKEHGKLK